MPKAIGTSPKMVPGSAPAQRSLDAVDQLDDLDLAGENRVERAFAALMNGEFPGGEMKVGRRLRQSLELGRWETREQRNRSYVIRRQHKGTRQTRQAQAYP